MKADVIIPTYKPDETFCLLLQKLQEQTFVIQKVIILNTEEILWRRALEKYPLQKALSRLSCGYKLIHVKKRDFDHGGTRMQGVMESEADAVVFMTQDAVPADRNTIKYLIDTFEDEQVAVAYARQLPKKDCHIVERYTRQFNYPDAGRKKGKADMKELGIKTFFCSDVCAAYRRDVFLELGGFDWPLIFGEDMIFAAKAVEYNYLIAYAAKARVYHSHNYSMVQQFHRNFDLAVSQKQHPEVFGQVSSESEGVKLIKNTIQYLFRRRKPWLLFYLICQCTGKYAGFWMGRHYDKLGRKWILRCTGSPDYWRRIWKKT